MQYEYDYELLLATFNKEKAEEYLYNINKENGYEKIIGDNGDIKFINKEYDDGIIRIEKNEIIRGDYKINYSPYHIIEIDINN